MREARRPSDTPTVTLRCAQVVAQWTVGSIVILAILQGSAPMELTGITSGEPGSSNWMYYKVSCGHRRRAAPRGDVPTRRPSAPGVQHATARHVGGPSYHPRIHAARVGCLPLRQVSAQRSTALVRVV